MNLFIGMGYLGRDPEIITNGCNLSLATECWTGKENKTIWLKVYVFGNSAKLCLEHKKKGDRILVEGRVDFTHTGHSVIISDNITFL